MLSRRIESAGRRYNDGLLKNDDTDVGSSSGVARIGIFPDLMERHARPQTRHSCYFQLTISPFQLT